jgi:hypothetical protein
MYVDNLSLLSLRIMHMHERGVSSPEIALKLCLSLRDVQQMIEKVKQSRQSRRVGQSLTEWEDAWQRLDNTRRIPNNDARPAVRTNVA